MDIVAVATDLMSQSRIMAAGKAAGRDIRFITEMGELGDADGSLALVDLEAGTDVEAMIRNLKQRGLTVVAFGPHLDTDRFKAARAAGADRVLARSKFVTELPGMMQDQNTGSVDASSEFGTLQAELWRYGKRMQELGVLLQDPSEVARVYFAPSPRMEEVEGTGEPIVLDSADYLDFLALDVLRPKLDRLRELKAAED